MKKLRKASEKAAASPATGADLVQKATEVNGVKLLTAKLDGVPVKALRDIMDDVRSRIPSGRGLPGHGGRREGGPAALRLQGSARPLHRARPHQGRGRALRRLRRRSSDLAQAGGTKADGVEAAFDVLRAKIAG